VRTCRGRYRRPVGTGRVAARRHLLTGAARALIDADVAAWVLDDVHPAQRLRDREAIARVVGHRLVYDHRPNHGEPLLWAADAICWAAVTGGGASPVWRASGRSGPDAQHPATHRPESTPGALPTATAVSTHILPETAPPSPSFLSCQMLGGTTSRLGE
jgi:hypothetical protein